MGLLMPGDLEKLVEKTRHLLSSSIRQLAAQHPELEIDQILGLKIDNDPHSAALLLAAAKLKLQTVLMASNRVLTLSGIFLIFSYSHILIFTFYPKFYLSFLS